jgi:hypothetical protein
MGCHVDQIMVDFF